MPVAGGGANRFPAHRGPTTRQCLLEALRRDDTVGARSKRAARRTYTYDELLDLVAGTLGVKIVKAHVPLQLMRPAVALMEALAPRPPVTGEQLKMIAVDNVTDVDSVERNFGFAPRPLEGTSTTCATSACATR